MYLPKRNNRCGFAGLLVASLLLLSCNSSEEGVEAQPSYTGSSLKDNQSLTFTSAGDDSFRGQVYGDMVYLSWQGVVGGSYKILRQNPTYQQSLTELVELPITSSFFKDRNLLIDGHYYYRLQVCSGNNVCTDVGERLSLKTTGPGKPKEAPVVTAVTYDSLSNQVTINWSQVPSAHKYTLWRTELLDNAATNSVFLNPNILQTSAADSTIKANKRYLYRVKSCSSKEACSGFSNQIPVAIGTNIIADLLLEDQSVERHTISFSWNKVSLIDRYEVQRRIDGNPYVSVSSLSYNKFIDSFTDEVKAVIRYRVRGVSDRWGTSTWTESQDFVLSPISAGSSSQALPNSLTVTAASASTSARVSAVVLPELPIADLPKPKTLITSKAAYAFWSTTAGDNSSEYFQIRVNQRKPIILSPSNPGVRVPYLAGEEIEFYACSDTYYACNKRFIINTSNLVFPEGQSQKAEVTAKLPEATGLSWHSELAEDFVYITEGNNFAFYQLLNPLTDDNDKQSVRINGLEQGKSYAVNMLNCKKEGKKSIHLCLDMSDQVEVKVPEYSFEIGFLWLQGKWNKGHLPVLAFDGLIDQQAYHLVVERQCVGLACLDLSQDVNQALESFQVNGTPALVTDALLADIIPSSWNQNTTSLSIMYTLSLCLADWTKCGEKSHLEVSNDASVPNIIGVNPAVLVGTAPFKIALSHAYQYAEQPVALHIDRGYSDRLSPSSEKNFQQVERQSYPLDATSQKGQVVRVDKAKNFPSSFPWYHYKKQLNVSVETQGVSIPSNIDFGHNLLMQDDLGNKHVEGVDRIIAVNDDITCVQLNDGTVSCLGDTSLVSSLLPEQRQTIAVSVIDKHISVPALPAYTLTSSSLCGEASGQLARVLSPISKLVFASESACLVNQQGQPSCLKRDKTAAGFGATGYLCPLANTVNLGQIEATTEAEHLCSLDVRGGGHCWGNIETAVPREQQKKYYSAPTRVHFFRGHSGSPALENILTGKGFSCMSLNDEEYCYSQDNGWLNASWPAQVYFPYTRGSTIDKAAYKGLICWLHNDHNSSDVHCIKSQGQPTAYQLPHNASQVDGDNRVQAFLLARLPKNVSNEAQLWLTKKSICVFDVARLWCAGDVGYNDYIYSQQTLLELSEVKLPYTKLHDFAASDNGRFCVSFGVYQRLGCWQSYNDTTSVISSELPEHFWPLMPEKPATALALATEYSCAVFPLSIGCWGKTTNPVVSAGPIDALNRAVPVMESIEVEENITHLVAGRSAACYRDNKAWNCWGKLSTLGQWFDRSDDDAIVPLSSPISPIFDADITSIALAKHYNAMCVVTTEKGFVYCSENNQAESFANGESQSDGLQPKKITDGKGVAIKAVSKLVYVGAEGVCALGKSDNSDPYAVYCWGKPSITGDNGTSRQRHQATKVIDNLPDDSQLIANSNADASLAYVLVYRPTTGTVDYWGRNQQQRVELRQVAWPLALQSLSIWPSDDPVLLGLTNSGHVYWQNLHHYKDFGSLGDFSSVSAITTGVNNICLRLANSGQLVCAGDNSLGKSGLIEQIVASGISQAE